MVKGGWGDFKNPSWMNSLEPEPFKVLFWLLRIPHPSNKTFASLSEKTLPATPLVFPLIFPYPIIEGDFAKLSKTLFCLDCCNNKAVTLAQATSAQQLVGPPNLSWGQWFQRNHKGQYRLLPCDTAGLAGHTSIATAGPPGRTCLFCGGIALQRRDVSKVVSGDGL